MYCLSYTTHVYGRLSHAADTTENNTVPQIDDEADRFPETSHCRCETEMKSVWMCASDFWHNET